MMTFINNKKTVRVEICLWEWYKDDFILAIHLWYTSIQGLNELKRKGLITSHKNFNVKSLKEDCANSAGERKGEIIKDVKLEGYFVALYGPYGPIQNPKTKENKINEEIFEKYSKDIKKTVEEDSYAIWRRSEIERKIICEKYGVKIKVIGLKDEGIGNEDEDKLYITSEVGEGIDIVYMMNYRNQFVPLLNNIEESEKVSKKEVYDEQKDLKNTSQQDKSQSNVDEEEVHIDQIDSEDSRSVDSVDYNEENTIHIINRDNAHFESILSAQKILYRESDNNPKPGSSFQMNRERQSTDYNKVNDRLEEFVRYFVEEFEAKLHAYHVILEGEVEKAGKFSDIFSGIIGQGFGGTVGGLIGFFLGSPVAGARLGAGVGKEGGEKLGSKIGSKQHKKKVINLSGLVDLSQNDKANFRKVLVKAGFDVFQSFEMQFMRVITDQGPKKAMQLLAKDATNRTINYYMKKKDAFITEGVVLGESKIEPVLGVPIANSKIKTPGFEIDYEYKSSKEKWSTASLYEKIGLVREGETSRKIIRYYEKKDGKSRVDKYGYRRLFISESWDKLKDKYRLSSNIEKSRQFTDYQYILSSKDSKRKTKDILEKINLGDRGLEEERITKIIKEAKDNIIKEINLLKKQSHIYKKDHEILTNIETNLKDLKIDKYLGRFKQNFEEVKQGQQKIVISIEASREENGENFNQLSQKQDIHHDDNKREHKKTQEGIERVKGRIEGSSKKINEIHEVVVASKNKQIKESIWFNVKEPVKLFTGRKRELSTLHKALQRNQGKDKFTVISQMTSISGLGGIGKSELVRKYAYDHGNDYDDNVIWINAENLNTMESSFRKLAKDNRLDIPIKDRDGKDKTTESIIREIYQFFAKRKSLFIFNNAEKNDDLNKFLPLRNLSPDANKPSILITSRDREWEKGIEVIDLKELELKDAIKFVKQGLGIKDESQDQNIKNLVKKLQLFPLAIQQAIAYIEDQRVTGEFEIDDYLREYETKTKDLLDSKVFRGIDNDYSRTTFTTWKITIDKIASDEQYGKLALKILDTIAYFAPEKINREIFLNLADDNKEQLKLVVRLLVKYSIINGEKKQSVLSIHRLVQDVTRLELEEQNKTEKTLKEALKLLENIEKKNIDHAVSVWNYVDKYNQKCKDKCNELVEEFSSLPRKIVEKLCNAGRYEETNSFEEKTLKLLRKVLGDNHLEVVIMQRYLGNAYGDLGKHQEKKQRLEEAKDIFKKHLNVAEGDCTNLQENYFQQALSTFKEDLKSIETQYTRNLNNDQKNMWIRVLKIEIARVTRNLSNAYGDLDDQEKKKKLLEEEVLPIFEEYLEIAKKQEDQELIRRLELDVARTERNLGNAYGELGSHQEKVKRLKKALEIFENHFKDAEKQKNEELANQYEVNIAEAKKNLGNAYGKLDNHQKRKELLEEALPILKRHYGFRHTIVKKAQKNLGKTYENLSYSLHRAVISDNAEV